MTAKHRLFIFTDADTIVDQGLIIMGLEDSYYLGVLSSQLHLEWALAAGGTLEDRPRYNNSRCFETFPFPACTPAQQQKIRALGEQLDAHRKRQQALHPDLTMTGMYNVLERVRMLSGEMIDGITYDPQPLNAKEQKIYEQGLIGILKQLHDELDVAVAEAYGWPAKLSTDEILTRLVALNAERAAEEAKGLVRWLRPEYQNKGAGAGASTGAGGRQTALEVETTDAPSPAPAPGIREWPSELPAQAAALRQVLNEVEALSTLEEIAAHFGKPNKKRLAEIDRLLQTMAAMGNVKVWNGKWVGV